MESRSPRTVVLADLHLVRDALGSVSGPVAALVRENPGARIIFAGDLFDLPASHPRLTGARAVREVLGVHVELCRALAIHVDQGGELWLLGGNHDAEVGAGELREGFLDALGPTPQGRARVRVSPWFFRDGAVHIEHGHHYDPDNAPGHPLVLGRASLGVHFVEQLIAPTGAHHYLQSNDDTPLKLFVASFTRYGKRAPYVIYRYFHTAIGAMLRSGPLYRAGDEVTLGRERGAGFAEEIGIPPAMIDELYALGATPTLESFSRTFTRVYFDRVVASLTMLSGLGALGLGARKPGAVIFGLGAAMMGASWASGHNRYGGTVPEMLAEAAAAVATATGARLVVFGHTHREALSEGYANTGSFAFPGKAPGRPYLTIEGTAEAPRAVRHYWSPEPGL
ncbi:MAG: hypothetical protein ABJE95_21645 [Byssovorax sp.]